VKREAEILEASEISSWNRQRQTKLDSSVQRYDNKQSLEVSALEKRISTARDEQRVRRKLELGKILQRYLNVCAAIDAQHGVEERRVRRYRSYNNSSSTSGGHSFIASQ
jgi:hypothetical protein